MINKFNDYTYEIKNDAKTALSVLRECRKRTQTEYNQKVKFEFKVIRGWEAIHTVKMTYAQVYEMIMDFENQMKNFREERNADGLKVYDNRGTYFEVNISTFLNKVRFNVRCHFKKIKRDDNE